MIAGQIVRFETGDIVPEKSQYLSTIQIKGAPYVYHYFLIETAPKKDGWKPVPPSVKPGTIQS